MNKKKNKKFEAKIKKSIGYVNTLKALDIVFNKKYKIRTFIPSDDETSVDFRMMFDLSHLEGLVIGVTGSGHSHMYQTGDGIVSMSVPTQQGIFILPTGEFGNPLYKILGDDTIRFGASANILKQIEDYLLKFKKYYEENYVNI